MTALNIDLVRLQPQVRSTISTGRSLIAQRAFCTIAPVVIALSMIMLAGCSSESSPIASDGTAIAQDTNISGSFAQRAAAASPQKKEPRDDSSSAASTAVIAPPGGIKAGGAAESSPPSGGSMTLNMGTRHPEPAAAQAEETKEWRSEAGSVQARVIDVFYATDRLPLLELTPHVGQIFLPVLCISAICCVMFIGAFVVQRMNLVWMIAACLGCCVAVLTLHTAVIRWQQVQRIITNSNTLYSGRRFESSDNRYPLHIGTASVTLPPTHRVGHFEVPEFVKLEFVESTAKHIVLQQVTPVDSVDAWFAQLRKETDQSHDSEAFVFIHGFNVTFDEAVKRSAQLAADLELSGPVVCYSWPSRGHALGYAADEATVDWSAPHLEQLLVDIKQKTGCKSLNVLAHSMGNRALLEALERSALRGKSETDAVELVRNESSANRATTKESKLLDKVILAAPDVDAGTFSSRYSWAVTSCSRQTVLYTSATDMALGLSDRLHAADRTGSALLEASALPGIETIDVTGFDRAGYGHGYYGNSPELITDMRAVLNQSRTAGARPWLEARQTTAGNTYWRLDAAKQAATPQPSVNR
ncbi:MAG: alpha/beta hydrolase [Pirellulales bacterium]